MPKTERAPRRAFGNEFHTLEQIYLGTDDGHPHSGPDFLFDEAGTDHEFMRFEELYRNAGPERTGNIHLISVVGGFYGLNLVPLLRPREITFFDVNPYQITYALLIARVLTSSCSAAEFLDRLTHQDYDVRSDDERALRERIALKQKGLLVPSRCRSKRTLARSWRYALESFDLTKEILQEIPITTRVDAMQSPQFASYLQERDNAWVYCSNVLLFVYFELELTRARNVVFCAQYYDQTEILDLAGWGDRRVKVCCSIPMSAREVRPRRGKS
jgi:hypothetical protein